MNRLQNKTAVITGGSSGIGFETARQFLAEGAKVIIIGRNKDELDNAVGELGEGAYAVEADVSKVDAIKAMRGKIEKIFPSLDILFVNAGIAKFAAIEDVTEEWFDNQFNTNFKGAYFTIQQLLPLFKGSGSIILNASLNAHIGRPTASIYGATKGALLTLAKNLSAELMPRKIRVNAVSAGPVDTPLHHKKGLTPDQQVQDHENFKTIIPIGRMGDPSEIAKAVLFFASDDAPFIVGAEILADGGMSL
ncbi:SDR family oxidoreductase [Pinibacter soli]|uniref:SDR family oxidoreductase n=1 Tax=Pinibacter soli TaxID=3044211 RepID=A0ABT6RF00_9BACT|nr:SDR family oxidoreductase [Pinibacter soli]MDI3321103.1 SDR family oxidoreductase [Pinibacter soli]